MRILVHGETRIKSVYKILFIVFVVLGVYYPSIFSGFNSIDDPRIISDLETVDYNLLDLLLPGRSHYYRPLIWISFYFDKYAWGLDPGILHLENILLHAGNAILVYLIADRIAGPGEQRIQLPLLSALLFSVHPINTEAVCWFSGRTDPLATLFILAAAYSLTGTKWLHDKSRLLVPAGAIFLGCLAKEVAFFYFPLAYLSTLSRNLSGTVRSFPWRLAFRHALPFAFFSSLYLYLRQSGLKVEDKSISILLTQKSSLIGTFITALKAFGFYVKKLFLPLPLNFAIVGYSDRYLWLGLVALLLLCWLLWQKRAYYFFLGAAFFLIFPAVLVAVKPIAWTPVAERYLYAPSAFFTVAFTGILFYFLNRKKLEYLLPLFLVPLSISCAYLTVERNLVWQDNYLLYRDAVAQSPRFARIRNEYGIALALRGRSDEARQEFETGKEMDKNYYLPILNLANLKLREGKNSQALEILKKAFKDKKKANAEILKMEARIYEKILFSSKSPAQQKRVSAELVDTYHHIYLKNKDPYMAYREGQLLLYSGEPQKAAILFEKASKEAPEDSFYKVAAGRLAEKLRKK